MLFKSRILKFSIWYYQISYKKYNLQAKYQILAMYSSSVIKVHPGENIDTVTAQIVKIIWRHNVNTLP